MASTHPAVLAREFHIACVSGKLSRAMELKEFMELPHAYPTTTLFQSLQNGKWEIAKFLWSSFSSNIKNKISPSDLHKNLCRGVGADYKTTEARKLSMQFLEEDVFAFEAMDTSFVEDSEFFTDSASNALDIEAPESKFDELGWNMLHWACSMDCLRIVKILVEEKQYNIETCEIGENTPLLIAAQNNCMDVVKYLMQKGANMNAVNAKGINIFKLAFQKAIRNDSLLFQHLKSSGTLIPAEYDVPQTLSQPAGKVTALTQHLQKENYNKLSSFENLAKAVSIPDWKTRVATVLALVKRGVNPCKQYSAFYPLTNLVIDSREFNFKLLDWCVEQGWAINEDTLQRQAGRNVMSSIVRNPKITHMRNILKRFTIDSYPCEPTNLSLPPETAEEQTQERKETIKQTAASSCLEGLRRQLIYREILRIGEVMEIFDEGRWKSFNSWHYAANRKFDDEPLLIRVMTKCLSYTETKKHLTDVSFVFLSH